MGRLLILFWTILFLSVTNSNCQEVRGIYVNGIDSILGDSSAELDMLSYLAYGNFNSISFYSLYRLDFRQADTREKLRVLIRRAKKEYGIIRVGAVSESLSGFVENIHLYNQDSLTLPEDRLDHYNIEFEFWSDHSIKDYYCEKYLQPNGFECNSDGAFAFVSKLIGKLRAQTKDTPGISIEMYIGWLEDDHAVELGSLLDRVLYAVYREMDENGNVELYDFARQRRRLEILGSRGPIRLAPIFTSYDGSRDINLASWLNEGHTVCEAWDNYITGFINDDLLINKENLVIDGYQWFKYSSMPDIPELVKNPGLISGLRKIKPNSTVRYSVPASMEALYYEWTVYKSGQNQRITTTEPVFTTSFKEPGPAMLQVRVVGCGKISANSRLGLQVGNVIYAQDTLLKDPDEDFGLRFASRGLHLTIPKSKKGPFHVQAMNLMGKKYLSKTITDPGEYYLEFSNLPDSSQILHVSIIHPGGSFSKKFSIFDHQD